MPEMTAFIIMPYSETYEKVYEAAISSALKHCGFLPVRADQIPGSRGFLEDIERSIRNCDLIVVEATDANKNVYLELGIARALQKETLLLTSNATSLPSDTRHIRHLVYDPSKLNLLYNELIHWIEKTDAYKSFVRLAPRLKLERGNVIPDILDATFFLQKNARDPAEEIIQALRSGRLINPKFIYLSDRGSNLWISLCNDPEYVFFRRSVMALNSFANEVLDVIPEEIVQSNPDIISLGPGNGVKDRIFLRALLGRQKNIDDVGYYYPFDISANMITHAVRTVFEHSALSEKIKVKAAICDFGEDLVRFIPLYQYRTGPNIFTILGNALGNFENEVAVLQRITKAMFPGDFLVLEVRTGTSEHVDLGGSESLNKQFDFNPLHILGVAYEKDKMSYSQKTNLSQVAGTKTMVVSYNNFILPGNGEHFESALLSFVHEYQPPQILETLKNAGLQVLAQHAGDGFHYYLAIRTS